MTQEDGESAIDLGDLGIDHGGHILVKRALRRLPVGGVLAVHGSADGLAAQLRALCRSEAHEMLWEGSPAAANASAPSSPFVAKIVRSDKATAAARVRSAQVRRGSPLGRRAASSTSRPRPGAWPPAARSSKRVFLLRLRPLEKDVVWTDDAARLYAQAAALQWDPQVAIPWDAPFAIPDDVEDAVVQVMTYLIENETAALLVPARFLAKLHPHFRE